MNPFRSTLIGAVVAAGVALCFAAPAQADVGFYIGPDGTRIYYDDDQPHYRPCHTEVSYTWRWGERMRVVDRVCYNRYGERYIADRDYYPAPIWYDDDD